MKKNFVFLIITLFLSGCASNRMYDHCGLHIKTQVTDEFNLKNNNLCYINSDKSFKTISGKRNLSLIKKEFKKKGIRFTEDKNSANCILHVTWGVYVREYTVNKAVLGTTGYRSSTTSFNSITGTATTTYTPELGITGYVPTTKYAQFNYLLTSAETPSGNELWETNIFTEDNDFDVVFPLLVQKTSNYIGKEASEELCYNNVDILKFNESINEGLSETGWNYEVLDKKTTTKKINKTIAIKPFVDSRDYSDANAYGLIGFLPLIPIAWATNSNIIDNYHNMSKLPFYIPKDFTNSLKDELEAENLFEKVKIYKINDNADYIVEANVLKITDHIKLYTYGLSLLASSAWFVGFPMGSDNVELIILITIHDRKGNKIFEKRYSSEGGKVLWFWGQQLSDKNLLNKILADRFKDIMNEFKFDLHETIK